MAWCNHPSFQLALCAFIAAAQTASIAKTIEEVIPILKSTSEVTENGGYTFSFEGGDGSFREETAVPMNIGEEDAYFAITGSYRYIDVNGEEVEVHYTADKNGFIPSGTNIADSIVQAARAGSV